MKRTAFILLSIIFLSFNESKKEKYIYEDENIKCSYETMQGRLDGQYVSYYKNGKKKSEGKFENNYRIGKWTVWDSIGSIRMQRNYSNPFTFKQIIPKVSNDEPIKLLNVPIYNLQYNKDGFIEYFYLKERMVVWAKRIWRYVTPKENPILFKRENLFSFLTKNIQSKNITPYGTEDDEFRKELTTPLDTSNYKIIAFKIKEDCFFDNERLVSESRIIGICPVAIEKEDTLDLYWIYFPELRKFLAQEKIQRTKLPLNVKTLDDLFFFRYFYGQIYKESNIYDRTISSYKTGKGIDKEAERIEISIIESEHDIWISFTK